MSRENVELVRSIYEDWERGDFSSSEWADPEIEYVMADGPSPGSWTGVAEMAHAWREVLSAWADLHAVPEHCRELDEERVLVLNRNTGRGKASGMEVGQMWRKGANVFHVRDGKVTRLVVYFEGDRALADLGLEG